MKTLSLHTFRALTWEKFLIAWKCVLNHYITDPTKHTTTVFLAPYVCKHAFRPSSCDGWQHSNTTETNFVWISVVWSLIGCSPVEVWDLPAAGFTFLANVSSLNDTAAQYPICDDSSVGSAVLLDATSQADWCNIWDNCSFDEKSMKFGK